MSRRGDRRPPPVHRRIEWTHVRLEEGTLHLPAWAPGVPIDEVVASVVEESPDGAGFALGLATLRPGAAADPGPPLYLGRFGASPRGCDWTDRRPDGKVEVDLARLDGAHGAVALRIAAAGEVRLRRVTLVATSNRPADRYAKGDPPVRPRLAAISHEHPFFSQLAAPPELQRRTCSPTSLAMVLAHHGVAIDPLEVARLVHDPEHGIYGNWARAVYAAGRLGLDGRIDRFRDWRAVHRTLEAAGPIVARIRVAPGELPGAPYERTEGHLVVVSGFDGEGGVLVADPAAPDEERGRAVHSLDRFARVWFETGGTAYVLFRRGVHVP